LGDWRGDRSTRRRRLDGWVAVGGFLLVGLDDFGDGEQLVALLQVDEADALGAAAGLADFLHASADALALGREEHDLVGVADAERASDGDRAVLGEVDRDDACAAAADAAVVLKGGALADAVLARDEKAGGRIADFKGLDVVAFFLEAHAGDAAGEAALGAQAFFRAGGFLALGGRRGVGRGFRRLDLGRALKEADGLALMGDEDELVGAVGEHAADDGVALAELHAADAALAGGALVFGQRGLLD
jgi:hypothetical protein